MSVKPASEKLANELFSVSLWAV